MTTHPVHLTIDPMAQRLMQKQREFQQRLLNGDDPSDLAGTERKAYIREQALALTDELHEALAETGWKSWATSDHINREAYASELADVYIFLMNLMLVGNVNMTDIFRLVEAKQAKNHKRQDDGYDGVSTKCPNCRRAYDDDAVDCLPPGGHPDTKPGRISDEPAWCAVAMEYLS